MRQTGLRRRARSILAIVELAHYRRLSGGACFAVIKDVIPASPAFIAPFGMRAMLYAHNKKETGRGMNRKICSECFEDRHLQEIVRAEGMHDECSICEEMGLCIAVQKLGEILEPILKEHLELGPEYKQFGEDDSEWWEQQGKYLSDWIQVVLGQYFDFEDSIVEAVVKAEGRHIFPGDGDEAFFSQFNRYVEVKPYAYAYLDHWDSALEELKHSRRFFSPAAQQLFSQLFHEVEILKSWKGDRRLPVVRPLKAGTKIYRARVVSSRDQLQEFIKDPLAKVGPPPSNQARAGRMNAPGVAVCYGARDLNTCLAEMRPAIGGEVALIQMEVTRRLRMLDFTRLADVSGGRVLSYFQPDYSSQLERRRFLRMLHHLISQPIAPGREDDYMITQAMAEYLAHVHPRPFDGILFSSAQRAGGVNIVLFAERDLITDSTAALFRLKYVADTFQVMSTASIQYKHKKLRFLTDKSGVIRVLELATLLDPDD